MRKEIKELIDNGSIFCISRDGENIEIDKSIFIQYQKTRKRTSIYKKNYTIEGYYYFYIYTNEKDYKEILDYIRTLNMIPACGTYEYLYLTNFLIRKEKLMGGNFSLKIEEKSIFNNYFYRLVVIKNSAIHYELLIDKTSVYLDDATRLFFEL